MYSLLGIAVGNEQTAISTARNINISRSTVYFGTKYEAENVLESYFLKGENLTADLIVTASGNHFDLSTSPSSGFAKELTLDRAFAGYIYVKFLESARDVYTSTISHTSTSATTKNISVIGAIGDGTETYPYPVLLPSHLDDVRNDLDAYYKQYANVNIGVYGRNYNDGKGWIPIGTLLAPFTGSYDGNNKSIIGMYVNDFDDGVGGLFRDTDTAIIKNVFITGAYINAQQAAPLIADECFDTTIINCHVKNTNIYGDTSKGGLVCNITGGSIDKCSSVTVASLDTCGWGGIFNNATGTTITKTWASVNTTWSDPSKAEMESDSFCGFGVLAIGCTITDCYAIGSVSGGWWQSGFIQTLDVDPYEILDPSAITNCYASVSLESLKEVPHFGGFVTDIYDEAVITKCYFDKDVAGTTESADGTPKSTAQMKSQATFSGWDFTDVWEITEGSTYPRLKENAQP